MSAAQLSYVQVRDQARRFITLVDELYNARTRLVCLAACPPDDLFGSAVNEEPLLDLEGLQFETAVEGMCQLGTFQAACRVAHIATAGARASEGRPLTLCLAHLTARSSSGLHKHA